MIEAVKDRDGGVIFIRQFEIASVLLQELNAGSVFTSVFEHGRRAINAGYAIAKRAELLRELSRATAEVKDTGVFLEPAQDQVIQNWENSG
jgi:hypothetical protein